MNVIHVELAEANAFVETVHRHHKPVQGHRFSIGAEHQQQIVGVAIVGRPVAPKTDQRGIVEVTRLATDGTKNACSFLYGAAARAAKELGYAFIQTFILDSETGLSLKAAGWTYLGESNGKDGWQSRPGRRTDQPICKKHKYGRTLR